ncbi:MAG: ATP-dependent DNA helicase RecG [Candidatus Paceibacterota bacterium]|jgi:ATP-dependent DNA helicase RecG
MNFSTPIEQLPKVGPQYQKKLKRLGIKTVGQLLFHFPHRYEDYSSIVPISQVEIGQTVSIKGRIEDIKNIRTFRKRMMLTQATVADESGKLKVMWFNQHYLVNTLKKGDLVFLAGKMNTKPGSKYLSAPAYEKIPENIESDPIHTGRLVPVYPETEGLSSRWLRYILWSLLRNMQDLSDPLPDKLRKKYDLPNFKESIRQIHFPDSLEKAQFAKKRFTFEELFVLSLFILKERMNMAREKSVPVPINLDLIKDFTNSLPFQFTDDQKKSIWQALKDMEKKRPMNRLLEGDVGSGKTLVAIAAALNSIKAGFQVAVMAPTEILTKQHYKTFAKFLKKYKLKTALMTGKETKLNDKAIIRKELLKKIKEGKVDMVIGTHALVQKGVTFKNLALVVIDEQHRFGVDQRARLCQQKETIPHLLSMTATPIPRTLSLTIYGDLDLSLIKEMPKGRKKIITKIIPPESRKEAYEFVKQEVKKGRQAFVICPRIEIGETTDSSDLRKNSWAEAKTVTEEFEKLSKNIFPEFKVGMLHGRMDKDKKERIMKKFKEGKTDILVSTSVIEVGIDIPNAAIMIIEGADKFGLAQLHQFRGRVGRGQEQSFCLLLTDYFSQTNNQRLRALMKFDSGFDLAEKDLEIRGPGDFSGQRQWGIPDITMEALKDLSMVEKTRTEAAEILKESPDLKAYPYLRDRLESFKRLIHLE